MSNENPTDDELKASGASDAFIERTGTVQARLLNAMASIGYIQKDAKNSHFKYSYLSERAVKQAVQSALVAAGEMPTRIKMEVLSMSTPHLVFVKCIITFADGQKYDGLGCGADKGDKAVMKAQTAAIRECWKNIFCIPSGDDPEADPSTDKDDKPANGARSAASRSADAKPAQGHPANKPTEEQLAGLKTLREGLKLGSRDISAIISHSFGKRFGDMNAIEAERLAELLTSLPAEVASAVRDHGDLTDVPVVKGGA